MSRLSATLDREPAAAREPITVTERDEASVRRFLEALFAYPPASQRKRSGVMLVDSAGEQIEVPEPIFRVLRLAAEHLACGDGVTIVPYHRQLTTQQAADLLNVSRPYLVRLLEEGRIPYTKTGTHRRIRYSDLMAFKEARDAQRRQALKRLTQMSQEMGLYGQRDERPG